MIYESQAWRNIAVTVASIILAATIGCSEDSSTVPDGGGATCGDGSCAAGQVCCDHCTGSCVAANSGAQCPDDLDPNRSCADAGTSCGAKGGPCCKSGKACGGDLTCCSGVPYPADGECGTTCDLKSDRAAKNNIEPVRGAEVLEQLASMPIHRWSYLEESPAVRHLGPMAQDFRAAFGLGSSDRQINLGDANGVTMAAVQALARRVDKMRADIKRLRRDNAALRTRIERLGQRRR